MPTGTPSSCTGCGATVEAGLRFCRSCGTPVPTTEGPATSAGEERSGELAPGTQVSGYEMRRFVAAGGMGSVYEATQLSLDRPVAFKLISSTLSSDPEFRERFKREAKLAASLDHPRVLPVYEAGEAPDGALFIAMRLVAGPDLGAMLSSGGRLDAGTTVELLGQVAAGLEAAHEAGLVHRDVKPANVLVEEGRDGTRTFLSDFGLAKRPDGVTQHTRAGELLGTVDYMAPEQIAGLDYDRRADVYAFGCMVYRCLTGVVPYQRQSREATLIAHVNAPVPLPSDTVPDCPRVLDEVVKRAMEKDPARRAESASDLMRWAAGELSGQPTVSVDESPTADTLRHDAPVRARKLAPSVALHLVLYGPLWAAAYLLGRGL